MKKKRNMLALLLMLVLCLGLFAACSGGSDQTDDDAPSQDVSTQPDSSPAVSDDLTDDDSGSDPDVPSDDPGDETEPYQDLVAQVVSVAEDGALTLALCQLSEDHADYTIEDYAAVALENYVDAGSTEEYVPDDSVIVQVAADGALTDATIGDIVSGDTLVFYLNADGAQTIAVYHAAE